MHTMLRSPFLLDMIALRVRRVGIKTQALIAKTQIVTPLDIDIRQKMQGYACQKVVELEERLCPNGTNKKHKV